MRRPALIGLTAFLFFLSSINGVNTAAAASPPDAGWPREIEAQGNQITIYQPQVEKWNGNQLEQRAAVSVRKPSSVSPVFGVIWMTARTEVDKPGGQVRLEDLQITRANFPSEPENGAALVAILRQKAPDTLRAVALDRLKASYAITRAESGRKAPVLKNDPPKIYYSSSPSLLVLIDGAPVLRDSGTAGLLRVVNTHALMLLDQASGSYYLYLARHWMKSSSENGPWRLAPNPSASLEKARLAAVAQKLADPMDEPSVVETLKQGIIPKIYVSTVPAELIQTRGSPEFQPVADTRLLYVKNATGDLFLDTLDQHYYLLTSGRWYRGAALEGQWQYVSPNALPADFARIPDNHPKGAVLASVSGTQQAQEAAISNDIPQTATIDRVQAHDDATYDGPPEFRPIEGTPLQYAINSATPIIEVDPHSYYSVQNGIWFAASAPGGPWVVTDQVPAVIYSIPPSSPLYYVTYVHVYGSTPRYVYVGYLPGYLGSYVSSDGVVVFGTGYSYPGWIGNVWYGPPVTYGFGVAWGPGFGWGFHLGFFGGYFGGPCYHPWWGPWGWAWRHGVSYSSFNTTRVSVNQVNFNQTNVYRGWGQRVVRRSLEGPGQARPFAGRSAQRANNLFADRQGHVFQHNNGNWHQLDHARNAPAPLPMGRRFEARGELERERTARAVGESRSSQFASRGPVRRPVPPPAYGRSTVSRGTGRRGR